MKESQSLIEARQVDLLRLIGGDTQLKRVASTNGGEWAGPCPFCGGRDRLRVQPASDQWWCRNCSPDERWQDAIAYVMKRDSLDFQGALAALSKGSTLASSNSSKAIAREDQRPAGPPDTNWQGAGRNVVKRCEDWLWDVRHSKVRHWLHSRGLDDDTLRTWHVGYNPVTAKVGGLWVLRGITIPYEIGGQLWAINVRQPDSVLRADESADKYRMVAGSRRGLFGADTLAGHDTAVITEGEFDAMLLWQVCVNAEYPAGHRRDLVGVATLGGAKTRLSIDAWADYLLPVSRLLVCYDSDAVGIEGSQAWAALTARARRITMPAIKEGDKDLTDFHKAGGRILDLITFEIARERWQRMPVDENAPESKGASMASKSEARQVDLEQRASEALERGDVAAYARVAIEAGWPYNEYVDGKLVDLGAEGYRRAYLSDGSEPESSAGQPSGVQLALT